jgi:hypothetical protein
MENLVAALDKIKTPLTLGGFVVIVLYGIYSQVLKLFDPKTFPPGSAALIVGDIVRYLFWLALLAVVLGVGSYLAVHFWPAAKPLDPDAPVVLKGVKKQRRPQADGSKL